MAPTPKQNLYRNLTKEDYPIRWDQTQLLPSFFLLNKRSLFLLSFCPQSDKAHYISSKTSTFDNKNVFLATEMAIRSSSDSVPAGLVRMLDSNSFQDGVPVPYETVFLPFPIVIIHRALRFPPFSFNEKLSFTSWMSSGEKAAVTELKFLRGIMVFAFSWTEQ